MKREGHYRTTGGQPCVLTYPLLATQFLTLRYSRRAPLVCYPAAPLWILAVVKEEDRRTGPGL
jgi:hypothetical protein